MASMSTVFSPIAELMLSDVIMVMGRLHLQSRILVLCQKDYWRWSNESMNEWMSERGLRPLLCTYRLNWDMRTSWGWWDDWDDSSLQTQDSKFEPWCSEAEHATSRSRRLLTIIILYGSSSGRTMTLSYIWLIHVLDLTVKWCFVKNMAMV